MVGDEILNTAVSESHVSRVAAYAPGTRVTHAGAVESMAGRQTQDFVVVQSYHFLHCFRHHRSATGPMFPEWFNAQ